MDGQLHLPSTEVKERMLALAAPCACACPSPPAGSRGSAQERQAELVVAEQHFNHRHLLTAFLYLVDVDEETGPFEYVPRSAPGGELDRLWPWRPLGDNYPPEDEFARSINGCSVIFTAPKGTIIFCNTSGFHRGSCATGKPPCSRR